MRLSGVLIRIFPSWLAALACTGSLSLTPKVLDLCIKVRCTIQAEEELSSSSGAISVFASQPPETQAFRKHGILNRDSVALSSASPDFGLPRVFRNAAACLRAADGESLRRVAAVLLISHPAEISAGALRRRNLLLNATGPPQKRDNVESSAKKRWGLGFFPSCAQAGDLNHGLVTAYGPLAGRAAYTFSDKPDFHQKTPIPMRSKHLIPKHLHFDGWVLPRVSTDGGGLGRSCQAAERG